MKRKKTIILSLVFGLLIVFYIFRVNYDTRGYISRLLNKIDGKTLNSKFSVKIKSGNLSTDYDIDTAIKDIDSLGLNTVNIPVVINIDNITASDMKIEGWSEEKAKKLIKRLKKKKVNIILEPYPWIRDGSESETEWLPNNMNNFFNNWKTEVLKKLIDDIAIPYHVDAMYIGSNFSKFEKNEAGFCDTIDYVRRYYKGLVSYRTNYWVTANWNDNSTKEIEDKLKLEYENKLNNRLFSKLDFISVAAYFELTDKSENTVDNLVNALQSTQRYNRKQNVKQELKNFYDKWGKPVFFGELGFPKTGKASIEPWNFEGINKSDNKEQANCFEAYRLCFEYEQWNLGFSVFAIGKDGSDKMYYPSEESAESIKKWYSK